MKNFIFTLTITLALVLTGLQNTSAQGTVRVHWENLGSCTCPLPGDSYWEVYCAVIDECNTPNEIVYEDKQYVDGSATSADFQLTEFCNPPTTACFMVIASAKKMCPDGQGGYIEICCGKNPGEPKTCQYLMDDETLYTIGVTECP